MSDQTPDSAERIAEDFSGPGHLPLDQMWRSRLRVRINALVSAAEERAKAEQAAKVRAALCPSCADGRALTEIEPGFATDDVWWHTWPDGSQAKCLVSREMHIALGTPTGGPDAETKE